MRDPGPKALKGPGPRAHGPRALRALGPGEIIKRRFVSRDPGPKAHPKRDVGMLIVFSATESWKSLGFRVR